MPYDGREMQTPDFSLEGLDGEPRRLDAYRGKVVLVNFWASWCPPCLAELPSMQRLADRMATEPFAVLAVNVGESPFRVAKLVKLTGVRFTVLLDPTEATFQAWNVTVYPTSFVLDAGGRVRYVAQGPLAWDGEDVAATIRELIKPQPIASE